MNNYSYIKNAILLAILGASAVTASATSIELTSPRDTAAALAATASMDAYVRNGKSGWEAALLQPGVSVPKASANFQGYSALVPGEYRNFEINYSSASGVLTLKIDVNGNSSYADVLNGVSETLTWDFGTDGLGFRYIDLYYRGNSVGNVDLKNLVVDGTAQGPFGSGGVNYSHAYFGKSGGGYFGDITISGQFDFTASTTSDSIPSFGVKLREQGTPTTSVPDAGTTLALFSGALTGLAALRRKLA